VSVLETGTLLQADIAESESSEQQAICLGNRHCVQLFNGYSLSSFAQVTDSLVDDGMSALDVQSNTFGCLVGSGLVFARLQAFGENLCDSVKFMEERKDGFALFRLISLLDVKQALDGGGMAR
jgi:hypothetical protein